MWFDDGVIVCGLGVEDLKIVATNNMEIDLSIIESIFIHKDKPKLNGSSL